MRRMTRFESEILVAAQVHVDLSACLVVDEFYAAARVRGTQQFNTDFFVEVRDNREEVSRSVTIVPIKPNTMGCDFFVSERPSSRRIRIELLAGESIPRQSFREEIELVQQSLNAIASRIARAAQITAAPLLRIVVLRSSIVFLAALDSFDPDALGTLPITVEHEGNIVDVRESPKGRVIDGVIRIARARPAQKLG